MSNPTMAKRIDGEPIDLAALGKAIEQECQTSDIAQTLTLQGHASLNIPEIPLTCRLLSENRCLEIEPRGEPGLSVMFNICRVYSQITGLRMVIFDQEFSFMLCVDESSTLSQFLQKMNADPYQGERMLQDNESESLLE